MPFISFSRSCCSKSAQKKKQDLQIKEKILSTIERNEFKQEVLEAKMELLDERKPMDGKKLIALKLDLIKIRAENQKLKAAKAELQRKKKDTDKTCCNSYDKIV